MSEDRKVKCSTHGWQSEAFVCQHIFESLHTGIPVGFHWPEGSDSLHPDAWCSDCESARLEAGGEWTEEVEAILGVKLLCGACYEHAKSIWANGRKATQ
jgi:hypothetical protein